MLWMTRRRSVSTLGIARLTTLAVTVVLVAASWKTTPAVADVMPPSHRVMATDEEPAVRSTSALTLVSMIEASRQGSSTQTVRSGDCLWSIARSTIVADGVSPTGASIADLWRRIYDVNAAVIGANPRLSCPGQVLAIPER